MHYQHIETRLQSTGVVKIVINHHVVTQNDILRGKVQVSELVLDTVFKFTNALLLYITTKE